jgi:predicted alpha/beta hydrolase
VAWFTRVNPVPLSENANIASETAVRFPAGDGFELGGIHYPVARPAVPARAVVFNSGGGIPARKYRRFARFLAESGIAVLTYDYRGIGLSRPRSLRGFEASLEDWSEYDCAGAIGWMRTRYPDAQLIGMGHSVGNVLFGSAPNAAGLAGFVLICPHTGYYGDYRRGHRLPMAVLWHGVMPVLTRFWGYFPAQLLRLGDDIPKGIALQWASRRSPDLDARKFGADVRRLETLVARCAELKGPALFLSFSDDAFATDAGVRRVLDLFPGLEAECRVMTPDEADMPKIGHFGYFREAARARLWPELLARLVLLVPERVAGVASAAFRDEGNESSPAIRFSSEEPF